MEKETDVVEIKTYDVFEWKDRGTVFCFEIKDNEHLRGIKLISKKVKRGGDIFIIKALEKIHNGFGNESRKDWAVLADKIKE